MLNAFRQSTIPQKQLIIIIIVAAVQQYYVFDDDDDDDDDDEDHVTYKALLGIVPYVAITFIT